MCFSENYASSCFVGIDRNGITHRGCIEPVVVSTDLKKFEEEYFPKGFKICYEDFCNNKVIPKNRFSCYQCEGEADCKNFKAKSKICSVYSTNDECYSYRGPGNFGKEKNEGLFLLCLNQALIQIDNFLFLDR